LLPSALTWLQAARHTLADEAGIGVSSFLTSVFSLVVGVERLFHLDQMEDLGFTLLCGGRCPSRFTVGGWRRHLSWQAVDAFCRRTSPWHLLDDTVALVSYDEHTLPRWTRTSAKAMSPHATNACAVRSCITALTWPAAAT
jgi:hypothetical protein